MVGGGGAGRGHFLSVAVGRRSRDPALVLHDRRGLDRRHGRPPRHHLPHASGRGADRAGDRAGSAGASELPEIERALWLDRRSIPNLLEIQGDISAVAAGRGERKPIKYRRKSEIGGEKSQTKSQT